MNETNTPPQDDRLLQEKKKKRQRAMKIISVIGLVLVVIAGIWGIWSGFFTDREAIDAVLKKAGPWAPILFLLVHLIQIVVPVVPGGACLTAGVIFFGPVWGFIYNMIGICAGSTIAFLLARKLGKPFIENFAEPEQIAKYEEKFRQGEKKYTLFFAVAILIPFMPDDLLCMIAGASPMKFRHFVLILLFCKIPSILVYSLGGAVIRK
ncbi:MAG: TVP38/TMEM64 family protein [Lachnospiraceae bacterium]|nr:TVP38/TMEM64 family protein [Lachnospiraceae bacterium]